MGTWGTDLYQNDTALDVKDRFEEELRKGKNSKEITTILIHEFADLMGDTTEEPIFWFALADTQWEYGRLLDEVKSKAQYCIKKGGDLSNWSEQSLAMQLQRKRMMLKLLYKLDTPQPPEKKPVKRRTYKCEWKIGDVFSYQLESELAKEKGLYGRHFLIQKVDEGYWHPGHIVPIVYVKITKDEKLPATVEEYEELEYVQIRFNKYEERFWPIDGRRPEEDIEEKSLLKYEVDDYGFLPHYRIHILNTSKKIIPEKLRYIGRFEHCTPPSKEFIPHDKINISVVSWQRFERTIETDMIERYCGHNLRQYEIYSSDKC